MNIEIGDYKLTSDSLNIIVNERRLVDPTKAPNWKEREAKGADPTPREVWAEIGYHGNVESALRQIVNHTAKTSEATTLAQLLGEIAEIRTLIERNFTAK